MLPRTPLLSPCSVLLLSLVSACSTSSDGPNLMPGGSMTFTGGEEDSASNDSADSNSSGEATGADASETGDTTDASDTSASTGTSDSTDGTDSSGSTDSSATSGATDATSTTTDTEGTTGNDTSTTGGDGDGDSACDGATAIGNGSAPLIDDFEDGNLSLLTNDGRSGSWSSWADGTGTLTPDVTVSDIADGLAGSTKALNFGGNGFTGWGAGAGPTFYAAGCYDFSAYTGVSFYAKGTGLLRMAVATADTHEFYDCDAMVEECSNHYHAPDITLGSDWTQYSYTWDQLAQPAWGPAKPFDQTKGVSLSFSHLADAGGGPDFDIWLDDLSFTTD